MKRTEVSFSLFFLLAAATVWAGTAQATTLVNEDFDGYADTTAMQVVWGAAGLGTLDNSLSFSAPNSAFHPGGAVNIYQPGFGTIDASASQSVILRGKIYDDAVDPNDRITIGLRGGPFPLFEMGRYNALTVPDTGAGYAIRAVLFNNGINPNYVGFGDGGGGLLPVTAGWHSYEATFSLAGLTVTLDLNSNGSIDSTIFLAGDGNPYGGFSDLRFGGPSNSSSAGGGANFDDIELILTPEPTSVLLFGMAGICLVGIRRR